MSAGRMFVIAVDSVDAHLVDEFIESMQENKEIRYIPPKGSGPKLGKRIRLLFSYPIDSTGRCLEHMQ
jgi:hypothetical protein